MSDNPKLASPPGIALPQYGVVVLKGPDSATFAQSQFMNDVAALVDAQWQWSGWLNPKGRIRALFALVRLDVETFWLVTTSDTPQLAADLLRFKFRSKVQIDAVPCRAAGRFERPLHASGATTVLGSDWVELDLSGDGGSRALRIDALANGDTPAALALSAVEGEIACDQGNAAINAPSWWAQDIAHGWPGLPGAALDAFTPQQLSLDRLNAFSVRKGCYPGQEIVARTHFLGRAKRGLTRIDGPGVQIGAEVTTGAGELIGTVVCAAQGSGLAVLPLDLDIDAKLQAGDIGCTRMALQGGLKR